jgi:histidinol dehydrogenase
VRLEVRPGVELERRWLPLAAVGIYVPRGLVSTLVMCAVPALAAGVQRIVVATPPEGAGLVAAAARLLGLDEVWALGGPPAIAAFAYGTDTIPRVDKICGPGGRYVTEAKLLVSQDVAIDLPAGPSEVVVLAGTGADERITELELAAQAEHGPDSVCTVVSVNGDSAAAVAEVDSIAPEHLVVLGDDAEELASRVRNAGAIFVGPWSSVAAGDYATGGNHVLPTAGWARSVGGIGLETFLKPVTVQRVTAEGLAALRPTVEALAAAEGMPAHAAAVRR